MSYFQWNVVAALKLLRMKVQNLLIKEYMKLEKVS